ncbi:MAG TPA: hypothetical protein VD969_19735 [Symbiobacteriaceae bacterium]|nr:hypothetical protein [Symbiobacteriaceae bacterium]
MAKRKQAPVEPAEPAKDDDRRIVHRWVEGEAEWGIQANGHYRALRYGKIEPGSTVRPKYGDTRKRGVVMAMLSGYGYPLRVQCVVNWGPPATPPGWVPDPRSKIDGPLPVIRWWPADELEAVNR